MTTILDDLESRGLIHDSTDLDTLRRRLDDGPVTLYCGFDPTADSLHVGHLVPLLVLRRFQSFGHHPIALAGGATGMIGDPSGRSDERNLLDEATLDRNRDAISGQLGRLLDFGSGPTPARLVDNRDWTSAMGVLEFLRDIGKHVTVNSMLAKESVKARVASESGISFTEFSYMLLQANDYLWLNENMGCELQVGGSDQWGNITAGIDLIRRRRGVHVHGLTVPLITRADGAKFGKTADGAVWLSAERTSPYAFYQYFINTDDRDVERFLKQLTMLPVDEIVRVMTSHSEAPERRVAQKTLALEVTRLIHGDDEAGQAESASKGFTTAASEMAETDFEQLVDSIPTTRLRTDALLGRDLVEVLVEVGLVASKGEARRLMAQSGIKVNGASQTEDRGMRADDILFGRYVLLSKGKKARHLLVVE